MAVTSFNGHLSFKQGALARLGPRGDRPKLSADQWDAFNNSPFMAGVKKTDDVCYKFTSARDTLRAQRDPTFHPTDDDFYSPKSFPYDKCIDYYKVLGIEEYASLEEVKKAFKRLSLVYHPDKTTGMTDAQREEYHAIFIQVKDAYHVLQDQATRRQYDRDRDRDRAAFEVNGFKPRVKPQFDACEALRQMTVMKKPEGDVVEVQCWAKLEKFVFGGHKQIVKRRQVADFVGFRKEMRTYRVAIPAGSPSIFEASFEHQGDHNSCKLPDTLSFTVVPKAHAVVDRRANDLVLRAPVSLGKAVEAVRHLRLVVPSVRGRHLLVWGQSPFFGLPAGSSAELKVRVHGLGITQDGDFEFNCQSDAPLRASTPAATSLSGQAGVRRIAASANVVLQVRHAVTDASVWVRVKQDASLAEIRTSVLSILDLPDSAPSYLQLPFSSSYVLSAEDRIAEARIRGLECSGPPWHGVNFTPQRCKAFLHSIIETSLSAEFVAAQLAFQSNSLRHNRSGAAEDRVWGELAQVLPLFGCEASAAILQEKMAYAVKKVGKLVGSRCLLEKIEALMKSLPVLRFTMALRSVDCKTARPRLRRHDLSPSRRFSSPFRSDAEARSRTLAAFSHLGGLSVPTSTPPALLRRIARAKDARNKCQLELWPCGVEFALATKPPCSIAFYSNLQQGGRTEDGFLPPLPVFAISLVSKECVSKRSSAAWSNLKLRLVHLLERTGHLLLQAARDRLPRSLPLRPCSMSLQLDFAEDPAEDGLDLIIRKACRCAEKACQERRVARRQIESLERRLARSAHIPVPWKRLGGESLRRGDHFSALVAYTHGLAAAFDAEKKASLLSSRAACFAKLQLWEESFSDSQAAISCRPAWSKIWMQAGRAALALGSWKETLQAFQRLVCLDLSGSALTSLEAAARESALGAAQMPPASKWKDLADDALRLGKARVAVAYYTTAIGLMPGKTKDSALLHCVLFSNRSLACCHAKAWELAVADARQAVAMRPSFVKARCRLGVALLGVGQFEEAYGVFASVSRQEVGDAGLFRSSRTCLTTLLSWSSVKAVARHRRFGLDLQRPHGSCKVYAVSDVHFERLDTEEWVYRIHDFRFRNDVLILAGNACDSLASLRRLLGTLKSKFRRVFYVPGNHETWLHPPEYFPDSVAKILSIYDLCDELDVDVFPAAVAEDLFIIPLLSWYQTESDSREPNPTFTDFHTDNLSRWPMNPMTQVWQYMLSLNEVHLKHPYHGTVVSFSHFLPSRSLPGAGEKATMCVGLGEQVKSIPCNHQAHVHGHSKWRHATREGGILYLNHHLGAMMTGLQEWPPLLLVYNGRELSQQLVKICE